MTYAVKVMLSVDDWIYITKNNSTHCWDLKPETFATKKLAYGFAKQWRLSGKGQNVKVVKYNES
jgi:hypothetical protein